MFASYEAVRQIVSMVGTVILWAAALLATAAAALTIGSYATRFRVWMIAGTVALFLAAFLTIIYFHSRIGMLLPLVNPFDGSLLGTYKIPPWIEAEKLLFWSLVFGFMALIVNIKQKRHRGLTIGVNLLLAVMAFVMLLASSPFSPPLPGFHQEILAYKDAVASGNPQVMGPAIGQAVGKMMGYYNSTYMWIHPPLLFLAYAGFGITFVGSILMVRSREKIVDQVAYNYGRIGYISLTLGLLLGYPWALIAWEGQSWWWDPKINMSLMMWVFFGAYLHARLYRNRRKMWKVTGVLGAAAFIALVATYLSTYVIPGIHSVAG